MNCFTKKIDNLVTRLFNVFKINWFYDLSVIHMMSHLHISELEYHLYWTYRSPNFYKYRRFILGILKTKDKIFDGTEDKYGSIVNILHLLMGLFRGLLKDLLCKSLTTR